LSDNDVILTGDESLQTRPMDLLINSINYLGIEAKSLKDNGKAPILIKPGYIGGETNIYGNVSSQFISSIILSSPLSQRGVTLYVLPEFKSRPYVENRFVKKGISKKRLGMELVEKGISRETIERVLEKRSDEEEIRKIIAKKRAKYDDDKLINYLVRQGFSYQLAQNLVHETD
ncbi:RecX family transcriptional regulator, partial [Candidatus Saccharibacteria bacterium]|nr:RecX family transcriptional regulator [Candidatus Saccharibacteria bacterium]